ncbi:hypothetical protein M3689_15245 [Alkalihalophilus marmarensis]|uniref:Uncharacterized protein n=1 Tax=Alkalihalophilus marmarensis DSM 21297 TaxID=1188261 RepID=U6SQ98_9BACI|nr:hypothetical protein [Alkalihalophilus marmarensis]ERN53803.1 hypothetical protein A33I_10005 [Alkalihalophilus marmarensis DSM 21297]MCM3490669.1 hypothetical protein [Alkalihalophilus marmarensis]
MTKIFEATYEGRQIRVENSWFNGEKLYVDGKLQDQNLGLALRSTLQGQLKAANGEVKTIKVTLGGTVKIQCKIFVDHNLVYPEEQK